MVIDFEGLNVLHAFLESINESLLDHSDDSFTKECSNKGQLVISNENRLFCKVCEIAFLNLEAFKQHRQSDDHVKQLMNSLSISNQNESFPEDFISEPKTGSPFFIIESGIFKIQCYKALLADRKDENYSKISLVLDTKIYRSLKKIQASYMAISLNGGGYFASAVFDNSTKRIVCSKTFRRYTSRRKQGGSQSLKDNQNSGSIHSAGATIRRENEKKLKEDILRLFVSWKSDLDRCIVFFCNRDPFLLQNTINLNNLRTLPFTTYQADYEEICRCYTELISSIKMVS